MSDSMEPGPALTLAGGRKVYLEQLVIRRYTVDSIGVLEGGPNELRRGALEKMKRDCERCLEQPGVFLNTLPHGHELLDDFPSFAFMVKVTTPTIAGDREYYSLVVIWYTHLWPEDMDAELAHWMGKVDEALFQKHAVHHPRIDWEDM